MTPLVEVCLHDPLSPCEDVVGDLTHRFVVGYEEIERERVKTGLSEGIDDILLREAPVRHQGFRQHGAALFRRLGKARNFGNRLNCMGSVTIAICCLVYIENTDVQGLNDMCRVRWKEHDEDVVGFTELLCILDAMRRVSV